MAPGSSMLGIVSFWSAADLHDREKCVGYEHAYNGSPLSISKAERKKRKKRAKIAKASRKRNRR